MVSLDQLKMFQAVVETRSLKAAADQVHRTQPALSHAIKLMEQQLELALFSRDGYRLQLTEAGQAIYRLAQKTLSSHQEMLSLAQHLSHGYENKVTLAIEASFDINQILSVLDAVQKEFGPSDIVIRQEYITGAFDLLKRGQADIMISPVSDMLKVDTQYESQFHSQGELINVAAPSLIEKYGNLQSVEDLRQENQIVVADSGQGTLGQQLGVQAGQRQWYVNNFASKLELIQRGMGWGRLPAHWVDRPLRQGILQCLDLVDYPQKLQFSYYVARTRQAYYGPVAQALWQNLISPYPL